MALVVVAVAISVAVAFPLGILAARRKGVERALRLVLDVMLAVPTSGHARPKTAERGYSPRWRTAFFADPEHQFCVRCQAAGLLNPGTLRMDGSLETNPRRIGLVVDHIVPHRGDQALFWSRSNWQALCHDHHDIAKQREEQGGAV